MGYKFSFLDNKEYSADDINAITRRLVTVGVADSFVNGTPYNTTKINDVIKAISHSGVVPEVVTACKVVAVDDNNIQISEGLAFFESGTSIEIDSGGVILQFVGGVKNYVYVKSNLAANTIAPYCSVEAPVGDYVMLAEIDADGTIVDKRRYAKGKLAGYQSNAGHMLEVDWTGDPISVVNTSDPPFEKQIYFTPNEFSTMVLMYHDNYFDENLLVTYFIDTDETLWTRYYRDNNFSGSNKRFLFGTKYPSYSCDFAQNGDGILFSISRTIQDRRLVKFPFCKIRLF